MKIMTGGQYSTSGQATGRLEGGLMKTKITELFGIRHPIVLSGMSWISVPSMVAAVSNAGGLGILATGPLHAEKTRQAIREIRRLTDKPFGANATLLFPGAAHNAKVLLEEKVPVINFSLGKGDWIVKAAHEYGGKVVATVVNHRHAKRAEEYGTDAVIVTGHEAAAHGGDVTSLVLIPSIADTVKIPVIAAGGFADGRGLAAALALGAEGIAMGTRFMTTKESPLHEFFKKLSLEKDVIDTLYSHRFDGLLCRVSRPRQRKAIRSGLDLPAAFVNSRKSPGSSASPTPSSSSASWPPAGRTRGSWPSWPTPSRRSASPRRRETMKKGSSPWDRRRASSTTCPRWTRWWRGSLPRRAVRGNVSTRAIAAG